MRIPFDQPAHGRRYRHAAAGSVARLRRRTAVAALPTVSLLLIVVLAAAATRDGVHSGPPGGAPGAEWDGQVAGPAADEAVNWTPVPRAAATEPFDSVTALTGAVATALARTGQATPDRATVLAATVVAEARRHGIPAALVFGILVTENPDLAPGATSHAGATGLMQVMPMWVDVLGGTLGRDLRDDATSVRYGVAVLAVHARESDGDWRRALLRYNGCVQNEDCHRYPDDVRRNV